MKDYYKILGVEENATDDEIKKQYRKLSKEYHPDVNPGGDEMFKEIAEAYENIGTAEKRAQYEAKKSNPFGGGVPNFEDLFSNMFNGPGFFRNQRPRKSAPDKVIKLTVKVIESYLGVEKEITYLKNNKCQSCNGAGGDQQRCQSCGGNGFFIKTFGTGFMVQQIRQACDTCGGKGYTLIHKCYLCDGRGTKTESHQIRVKLPVGVDDGQFIKLPDLGDFANGDYGDLVLQIELDKSDNFDKIGNDLIYKKFLSYEELKNTTYLIPHPEGDLNVSAPKTFDTSKPLRIRGKGFNGGDMYVNLFVKFERIP